MPKKSPTPKVIEKNWQLIAQILEQQRNQQSQVALNNQAELTYAMEMLKTAQARITELETKADPKAPV